MSKKKRWFQKGSWAGAEKDDTRFSNTIAQHSKKLKEQGLIDEDGFERLPEDDDYAYGYSSRNWDWDQKLLDNTQPKDDKQRYDIVKSDYHTRYSEYERTGHWYGYYRAPQLSYKYVQQMANALSAQHSIKVQVGSGWNVDLLKKTLTYNPASLIYGTKSELLATLMHEIGKLRYVTHSSLLKNKYLAMYDNPAKEVLSIYEDLRTDFLMLKAYESAAEIYESIIPTIEKQVASYMEYGETFRDVVSKVPRHVYDGIMGASSGDDDPVMKQKLRMVFGSDDPNKVHAGLEQLEEATKNTGTIYEWCGEMLASMYDLDEQKHKKFENIQKKVEQATDTIEPSKKTDGSQALVDYLDNTTYPIVEDLLKDAKDKNEAIQKAFPQMPQAAMGEMMSQIMDVMANNGQMGVNVDEKGNMVTRNSGQTDSTVPPEWENGDYRVLKDSVLTEIRQLINRLTFIRREELTVRYQADQKRGKLNSRKLYKASSGSRRLFKKKLDNTDTIQSFAFSLLLDVSGSMSGDRIVHCTRALIILSEVFKKMSIPFEIITFSDGVTRIKGFEQEVDKNMERQIGGIVKHSGGGTNLRYALDEVKIHAQPQKNKIVVVLTDGGVGGTEWFDQQYFAPWLKKNIKSVGFGVECEPQMAQLCLGHSKVLENASQLPVEFSTLLKNLIKR